MTTMGKNKQIKMKHNINDIEHCLQDAQSLADLCPVGMIFVPSVGGASHAPRELTEWQDCINGANVLLQAALALAFSLDI